MLVLIGVFLLIHLRTEQTGMASLSVLAILAVTHWFWFPVHYVFNAYGIQRRILGLPQRFPWARIEGYQAMQDGIRICRSIPSSNSLRSFFVAWSRHRKEIESIVAHYTRRTPTRKLGSSSVSFRSG